jgi:hypothetical protein
MDRMIMDSFEAMMIALTFNDKINKRDLNGLVKLMTNDHIFIDNSGNIDNNMKKGWKQFFENYSDYRNIFTSVSVTDNVVVMIGHSTCSKEPRLNGPSMWIAKIQDKKVAEWRVIWLDQR